MKHKSQTTLKKQNDIIAIAVIKGHLEKDNIKEAVEVAEKRKFTPVQFGAISRMIEEPAEEIYKKVIA